MSTTTLPLPTLFRQALSSASKAANLPTIDDETQELVQNSLKNLSTLDSRIIGLSLFSPNESLEDISTRDLVYLLVPYVYAEVQGRVRTTDRDQRMISLNQAQRHLQRFIAYVENYEVVPEDERALHEKKSSTITDPSKRRELKIQQYKKEKELKTRIEVIRKRRRQLPVDAEELTDFDLISSLLPSSSTPNSRQVPADDDADEEDSETDDILRETTLLLLRLTYAQAHSHLESMDQELQLLHSMPPPPSSRNAPPADDKRGKTRETDDMWKLDAPAFKKGGPLLDPDGKLLQPFTILPSSATADRARLQSQVFGPGHRLPTMTIDEYLQIERERGNIIEGGGAASAALPTTSEQLALDSEMDGTRQGEERSEAKRLKDENWARFTDENPKGAGNTMNRG